MFDFFRLIVKSGLVCFSTALLGATAPVTESPSVESQPREVQTPPKSKSIDYVTVPFAKAESEVLEAFQKDIVRIENLTNEVAVYQVQTHGNFPVEYSRTLRARMERLLMGSKQLMVKDCSNCDEASLIKDEDGTFRYEELTSDSDRPAKLASQLKVKRLLIVEMVYNPEELVLRTRLLDPFKKEIVWMGEYSTQDTINLKEKIIDNNYEISQKDDSLSHAMIGEIAFTTVLGPGMLMVPSIDSKSGPLFYPGVDLLLGEKYNRNKNRFGFLIGMAAPLKKPVGIRALPFVLRIAPQFRHTFNPYDTSFAKFSLTGEIGGMLSTGLATAYIGVGPELTMMKRFSVSLIPMFVLPASVEGETVQVQQADGSFSSAGASNQGKFGGFAMMLKGNFNW